MPVKRSITWVDMLAFWTAAMASLAGILALTLCGCRAF